MQQPLCHYWSLAEGENLPLANFFKEKRSLRLLTHHPCCAWIPPPLQRADKWHTGSALVPLLKHWASARAYIRPGNTSGGYPGPSKQWASARGYIRPGNTSGGYPGRQSNGHQPKRISALFKGGGPLRLRNGGGLAASAAFLFSGICHWHMVTIGCEQVTVTWSPATVLNQVTKSP